MPGYGIAGDSEWRIYYDAIDDSETTITIQRVTGTFDEVFDGVRILVIPSTSNQVMSRLEAEVDFKNYEAVKRYYQLTE